MGSALLLSISFAALAFSKAVPEKDPIESTLKSTITYSAHNVKRAGDMSIDCVTQGIVDGIIDDYTYLLTQPGENPELFNATATRLLSDDFHVYSDSIFTLANITLGKGVPAYPSRDALQASQFRKGIAIPIIKTLDVFHTCNKIAWRCTASGLAQDILPVNMMFTFDIVPMNRTNFSAPGPVPAAVTAAVADSTIGSPANPAVTPSTNTIESEPADSLLSQEDTGSVPPGCTPGVSTDGGPGAGDCPAQTVKAKRHWAAIEDYERPQWKIKTVYSEFNTGAWIRDMGSECAMPAMD